MVVQTQTQEFAVIHTIIFLICRQLRLDMGCDCDLSLVAVMARASVYRLPSDFLRNPDGWGKDSDLGNWDVEN